MNNNIRIIKCEECDEVIEIDMETTEVSEDFQPPRCNSISCPYNTFDREGGDPEPLNFKY